MDEKIVIYQVLPRLFGNTISDCVPNSSFEVNGSGKLDDFSFEVLEQIASLGCTHIWFTGVIRQATQTPFTSIGIEANHPSIVKGKAGSPYSITDYYDISPELAVNIDKREEEFQKLLKRCHDSGLRVIMDFVPNHLSREYKSIVKPHGIEDFGSTDKKDYQFHPMNNFFYLPEKKFKSPLDSSESEYYEYPAKVTGNDCTSAEPSINDWFETVKLNYGRDVFSQKDFFDPIPDTWLKMKDILIFWINKGIDGFRCDMVGMVPESFWHWIIPIVKEKYPKVLFIGEIYEKEKYSTFINYCNFDYLYDKVGLYDTLRAIYNSETPVSSISECWQSLGETEHKMLNFLENHDEVRIASDFFLKDAHKALPALTTGLFLNKAPYLIYFGQELGEKGMDSEGYSKLDGRTSIFDYWSLPSIQKWIRMGNTPPLRETYKKLISIATREKAVIAGEKFDLKYANDNAGNKYIFPFFRKKDNEIILVVSNFSDKTLPVALNIPSELFHYFNIPEDVTYSGKDLITGIDTELHLSSTSHIEFTISGYDVKIIKLLL